MNLIKCVDCGAERKAIYKNTKYCRVCRLSRNLDYLERLGWDSVKCVVCDARFAPMKRGDQTCPKCSYLPQCAVVAPCGLCGTVAQTVDKDIAVCYGCATDKKRRREFQRALKKKVYLRKQTPDEELRLPPDPPKPPPRAPDLVPDI